MKHDNVNYLLVGGFVLTMLVGLLIVLALLTGRTGTADLYYTHYDNVAGLQYGTLVTYEGYHIGQIEQITPLHSGTGTRYRVDISVSSGWRIPADSVAGIVATGLLSAINIDIQEGKDSRFLNPGDLIQGQEGADLFGTLADAATEVSTLTQQGIRPLLDRISESLVTVAREAEAGVPEILGDFRTLSGKLNDSADAIPTIVTQVGALTDKLNAAADQIQTLFNGQNRGHIERFIQHLDGSLTRLDRLLAESKSLVVENRETLTLAISDLRDSLRVVAQHIDTIAYNMEGASRNMNEFSRQIRANPGLLLGSTPPPDAAREGQR